MTFTNCPKCGSSNVTTAGVCANCGWTRFPQAMGAGESKEAIYNLVGEIEIKVTGKALLDDYKRLLFENNKLTARIAELEAENNRLAELLLNELSQVEIATDLGNKRWTALNKIYQYGEKHNTNWCKRIAQEGLGIKNA